MSLPLRKFQAKEYTAGDRQEIREEREEEIKFKIHRFTDRERPDPSKVIIYPAFSEFGSEIVGSVYCIPKFNEKYADRYKIVMGWYGRAFLYRHLCDEFWEINEQHQWLREWCRAFHHESQNLKKVEKNAASIGEVLNVNDFALVTGHPYLNDCLECKDKIIQLPDGQKCIGCNKVYGKPGLFSNMVTAKSHAVWPPMPTKEKCEHVRKYLKPNSVGISARARKCYGRNLPPIFYERLIYLLEDMGYNPVWIGEKVTTLPCPLPRVVDFSRSDDSADLEMTLALVSQLKFTVQFWTASTRLAGLVGTPFILVESPDQIWGVGQEGLRLTLCTKGDRKLIVSHYRSFLESQTKGLKLVERAVTEMERGNYSDIIGMVESEYFIRNLRAANQGRIGVV